MNEWVFPSIKAIWTPLVRLPIQAILLCGKVTLRLTIVIAYHIPVRGLYMNYILSLNPGAFIHLSFTFCSLASALVLSRFAPTRNLAQREQVLCLAVHSS